MPCSLLDSCMIVFISAFHHIDIGLSKPNAPPTSLRCAYSAILFYPHLNLGPYLTTSRELFFFFQLLSILNLNSSFFLLFPRSLPSRLRKKRRKDEQLDIQDSRRAARNGFYSSRQHSGGNGKLHRRADWHGRYGEDVRREIV